MSGAATKWRGAHVEILTDGTWRFHTCLRCHGPLSGRNQIGYGPDCKAHRPLDWRTQRRHALKKDRDSYRADRGAGAPI